MDADQWTSSDPGLRRLKSQAVDEYCCYLEEFKGPVPGLVVPRFLCRALEVESACSSLSGDTYNGDVVMVLIPLLRYELAEAIKESLYDVTVFQVHSSIFPNHI